MDKRHLISVSGEVIAVSFSAPTQPLAYEVCLQGAYGFLQVRWLGRREVPGVSLGSRLQVTGIPVHEHGVEQLINPDYELLGGNS